jgi:ABC-type branched-subunit amino acid transport system substrate-binding protein
MLPRIRPTRSRARRATIVLLVCVFAVSCGSDHGNDTAPSGGTTTPGQTTTAATAAATFGTLRSPCGGGTAKGGTANGVTDTSITIGYGDDAGYSAAPGLDKEMSDAMKAMIDWCDKQGGINGREVIGNYYDAQVLQVTQAITRACNDKVFMLVGQGWVLDSGQETTRIQCQLSSIPGFAVATAFAHGSGVQQPIPSAGDQVSASSAFEIAKMFPDAVKKAALVFAEFPATRETRDKYAAAYPKAGWTFLPCDQIYNTAGESDWKPFASNLKSCGVEAVVWVGSPDPNLENFLNAAKQVGFRPQAWLTDPNQYTASFAEWNGQNGGAADNVYVRMTGVPFEFAKEVPAVQQYMDLVAKSNGTTGLLGEQAASAFLLWATAVRACGSNVTAKCVLDAASEQKQWTGGGLHLPTDPGANTAPNCGMLLKLKGASWVKVVPDGDTLFDCKDEYLVTDVSTAALDAAKLNEDRVATQYGTYTPH